VSLVGIVASIAYSYANPLPGLTDSGFATVMPIVILAITALLAWYARRMTAAGVLR
jgi:hypothetical protein